MSFELAELERRMANMIRVGEVVSVNAGAARCRIMIDELTTAELPWLAARAGNARSWWAPSVGEQVVVFSPFGDLAQGFVIPALYQNAHAAPDNNLDATSIHFKDGAVIEYEQAAHRLRIDLPDATSDVVITSAGTLNVTTTKGATVQAGGNVNITGTVVAMNNGAGVVTKECICALTGLPHSDGSATVKAGK